MCSTRITRTIVPEDSIQNLDDIVSQKSTAIIEYAKNFLGVPYVWGGMSPSGFDCSGFINYVFKGFGLINETVMVS